MAIVLVIWAELGLKGLIRKGDVIWIIGFNGFLGISNNNFVDPMAIHHGVKITVNLGYSRIICYSNSQNCV